MHSQQLLCEAVSIYCNITASPYFFSLLSRLLSELIEANFLLYICYGFRQQVFFVDPGVVKTHELVDTVSVPLSQLHRPTPVHCSTTYAHSVILVHSQLLNPHRFMAAHRSSFLASSGFADAALNFLSLYNPDPAGSSFDFDPGDVISQALVNRLQVLLVQRVVSVHSCVLEFPIDPSAKTDFASSVKGSELVVQGCFVSFDHAGSPFAAYFCVSTFAVLHDDFSFEDSGLTVEFLEIALDGSGVNIESFSVFDIELQRQPIGAVHKVFIPNLTVSHLRRNPVEYSAHVGSWLIH